MYKNYTGDKNLLPLADVFLLKVCVSIFLWHFIYIMYSVYTCAYEVEQLMCIYLLDHTHAKV